MELAHPKNVQESWDVFCFQEPHSFVGLRKSVMNDSLQLLTVRRCQNGAIAWSPRLNDGMSSVGNIVVAQRMCWLHGRSAHIAPRAPDIERCEKEPLSLNTHRAFSHPCVAMPKVLVSCTGVLTWSGSYRKRQSHAAQSARKIIHMR